MPAPDDALPEVRVLHQMARSGGTAIAKCLAVMDGVLLLSEIHPLSARLLGAVDPAAVDHFDPVIQARDWFGLFTPAEADRLARGRAPFDAAVAEIASRAAARDARLVLRDWSHLDYTGVPLLPVAVCRPLLVEALGGRFRVLRAATVRHPLDQWLSLRRLKVMGDSGLTLAGYLAGYRRFAEAAAEVGFVRYEDFTADPDAALKTLCGLLQLPFDPGYRERWRDYRNVTGETVGRSEIQAPPRPPVEAALRDALAANADYRAALERLGYAHPA